MAFLIAYTSRILKLFQLLYAVCVFNINWSHWASIRLQRGTRSTLVEPGCSGCSCDLALFGEFHRSYESSNPEHLQVGSFWYCQWIRLVDLPRRDQWSGNCGSNKINSILPGIADGFICSTCRARICGANTTERIVFCPNPISPYTLSKATSSSPEWDPRLPEVF